MRPTRDMECLGYQIREALGKINFKTKEKLYNAVLNLTWNAPIGMNIVHRL